MNSKNLLVTGVSGHFGRAAASYLLMDENLARASHCIGTTRTPAAVENLAKARMQIRFADFDLAESLFAAFQNSHRLLLVSTTGTSEKGQRVQQHRNAIGAAVGCGAEMVVYTSIQHHEGSLLAALSADHVATERMLHDSPLAYRILRNATYSEILLDVLPKAIFTGVLPTIRRTAGVAYISRDDCAFAATCALQNEHSGRALLNITGSSAVTADELAHHVKHVFDVELQVDELSQDEYHNRMLSHGGDANMAQILTYLEAGFASGAMSTVTTDFSELTSRPPGNVGAFMRLNKDEILKRVRAFGDKS